jgi:hypothetical protein
MSDENSTDYSRLTEDELSRRWRQESQRYASAINAFVAHGLKVGWENVSESEPKDARERMAQAVLGAVRRANKVGSIEGLRERFPPAHGPFLEALEENGQSLPVVLLLDDGRIAARIGAPYEQGRVVVINDRKLEWLPREIVTVGRSPNRKYFAVARESGVTIHRAWEGPITQSLRWPTGKEGVPRALKVKPIKDAPIVSRLIPFDDGSRALLVSPVGIFVLAPDRAVRLLPTEREMQEHFEHLSMEHGAISPDGRFVACGYQSSLHYVFDANTLSIVGEIGPVSEYPHYAAFSSNGTLIAFNSCHFYGGITIGVPTSLLPGLKTEPYEDDDRLVQLEEESRVYAAIFRGNEFVIGDASGYLRAFDVTGRFRWQHFIGSTVGDIDVSLDEKVLVVTTYAGFLSIIDMDTGTTDPFAISTTTHRERRRWLFWKKEPHPLIW